jgi:hypothetical protein
MVTKSNSVAPSKPRTNYQIRMFLIVRKLFSIDAEQESGSVCRPWKTNPQAHLMLFGELDSRQAGHFIARAWV